MSTMTELFFSAENADQLEFLRKLRSIVRSLLGERNLLEAPPSFLGYVAGRWSDAGALDEIAQDAYEFTYTRKTALAAQRKHRPNLDPMFRTNVRHFIYERQKQFDPLGYRVLQNVLGGLRRSIEAGTLAGAPEDERLRTTSLLTYSTWTPESSPAHSDDLVDAIVSQGDWENFLEMLTDRISVDAQVAVERRVDEVPRREPSIHGFVCRDLCEPLKNSGRAAWLATEAATMGETAIEEQDDDGPANVVYVVAPEDPYALMVRDAEVLLARATITDAMRTGLRELLYEILRYPDTPQAERARRLGIPKQTLNDRFRHLRDVLGGAAR